MNYKRILLFLLLCTMCLTGCSKRTFEDIKIVERSSERYSNEELLNVMKIAYKQLDDLGEKREIFEMRYAGDVNSDAFSDYLEETTSKKYELLLFIAKCDREENPLNCHLSVIKTDKGWKVDTYLPEQASIRLPEE